jgi:hemerythrin-like domain-containing protein
MISTIRKQPQLAPADVIDQLFACHGRIRSFARVAERLAADSDATPAQSQQAAQSLLEYFLRALPLHVADEDLSIRPRLHEVELPEEVREAMSQMSAQHIQIDLQVAALLSCWETVSSDPAQLAAMPADFVRGARRLRQSLEAHLALEEETIFPAMRRYLSSDSESVIAREMRERRTRSAIESSDSNEPRIG